MQLLKINIETILMTSKIELNIILDLIPLSISIQQLMMEPLYARLQAHGHVMSFDGREMMRSILPGGTGKIPGLQDKEDPSEASALNMD